LNFIFLGGDLFELDDPLFTFERFLVDFFGGDLFELDEDLVEYLEEDPLFMFERFLVGFFLGGDLEEDPLFMFERFLAGEDVEEDLEDDVEEDLEEDPLFSEAFCMSLHKIGFVNFVGNTILRRVAMSTRPTLVYLEHCLVPILKPVSTENEVLRFKGVFFFATFTGLLFVSSPMPNSCLTVAGTFTPAFLYALATLFLEYSLLLGMA
jgi:hypothetical protein